MLPDISQNSSISGPVTPTSISNFFVVTGPITSNFAGVIPSKANTTPSMHSNNSITSATIDLSSDMQQQLNLEQISHESSNSNIPNCARVTESYSAITEDEISVQKGDLVQIITANMHNRFLVHREANEHQPAAEGWIPGFVIGFQSTNII